MSEGSWHETYDESTAEGATASTPPLEHPGQVIGRYHLLQLLGEGGFGSVWMAEQREPVKRRVALKIIKLGMDTRQVIARFEAERQALAMMEHPNIARVFDAGATETGRPYFVMELVRGVPIVEYCDQARLDTPGRLRLFVLVCQAIQHAHQKGVIHRDIKPGNVLVTLHDGVPVPKVIDFGIAKATNQELTSRTLFTEHRQLIGTPAYMSPEQAEMSGLDIDTRSDVYSLGVLLYELLTGTTPFKAEDLASKGFVEMMRIIREETPHKPSTRLSTLGEIATRTAERRHADPKKLGLLLRGDLDWIVMRCLEKDRTRRYGTALGLAADVERHLRNEPVEASPPSTVYRIRKCVRRNRGAFVTGAAVAALLLLGSAGTIYGLVWALDEKSRAERAEAETARRANELQHVVDFQASQIGGIDLEGMGVRLRSAILRAVPEEQRAQAEREMAAVNFTSVALGTLQENVFERTIRLIHEEFESQPLVRAQLLHSASETLIQLGLAETAEESLRFALETRRRLLGSDDPATLASVANMGTLMVATGRYDEAEPFHLEALEGRRRVLGVEDAATLESLNNLAVLRHDQGRYDEAEAAYRKTIETSEAALGADHPATLKAHDNLGVLLQDVGRVDEAEPHMRRAVEGRRRVLGPDDADTLRSVDNLAGLLWQKGSFEDAIRVQRDALAGHRRVLGDDHPDTISAAQNLGIMLMEQDRFEEAEPYYLDTLERSRRVLGPDHPLSLASLNNMAAFRNTQGNYEEAESFFRAALDGCRRVLGAEHPSTLTTVSNLGYLLFNQRKYDEAQVYYEEAVATRRRVLGDDHEHTLIAINNLAFLFNTIGRFDQAVTLLAEGEPAARRVWTGENNRNLGLYLTKLGQARGGAGAFVEGEAALLEAYEILAASFGPTNERTTGCAQTIATLYEQWNAAEPGAGRNSEAERWRARAAGG